MLHFVVPLQKIEILNKIADGASQVDLAKEYEVTEYYFKVQEERGGNSQTVGRRAGEKEK